MYKLLALDMDSWYYITMQTNDYYRQSLIKKVDCNGL